MINLGQHYQYKGKLDTALDYYFHSKELMEEMGLNESVHFSALLNNIGTLFNTKGRLKRAMEFSVLPECSLQLVHARQWVLL